MFYFLSKAVDFLIMPLSIIFYVFIYAFVVKDSRRKKQMLGLGIALLALTSNQYLVTKAINAWEYRLINLSEVKEKYDVGILLSGGLITTRSSRQDHPALGDHGDRILQTYLLYKHGKIRKILITGASGDWLIAKNQGETRQTASLLASWGVPASDIMFEEKARNTRENALFSARILNKMFPGGKYLLVTSAFHMRRSTGCFEKVGIQTDPFPADFNGGYNGLSFQKLIPDPDAFADFCLLWHELIGYMTYKIVGYC